MTHEQFQFALSFPKSPVKQKYTRHLEIHRLTVCLHGQAVGSIEDTSPTLSFQNGLVHVVHFHNLLVKLSATFQIYATVSERNVKVNATVIHVHCCIGNTKAISFKTGEVDLEWYAQRRRTCRLECNPDFSR